MTRNLKVIMSYKGTAYHGFQRQENAVGIQNVLEDRLSLLLQENITIAGCSRTDAGVHANEFCFSFNTANNIPNYNLVRGINKLLPEDMAISGCDDVPPEFHARFSCVAKEYYYLIFNGAHRNPFMSGLALHYPYKLDIELISQAAESFEGTHDFTSFCGSPSGKLRAKFNPPEKNRVRTVEYFKVNKNENFVKLIVKGDGFLYNMIRIMAGTLIYINEGKLQPDSIPHILAAKDRTLAGKTANAHGLYLNRVFY